ncbi:MAG: SDR family oxidoreductase [Lysobacterales bacterium]
MILVLGATGRVGGAASAHLAQNHIDHRVLVRDASKFSPSAGADIEVVVGDLANEDDVQKALAGVTSALLVVANSAGQPTMERQFASAAAAAGVQHLVKVSSMEAGPEVSAAFPRSHYETEQHISALDLQWTFLRPNFYMQNMLMYAGAIANAGLFALPLGQAKTAMVDTRDVGVAAAISLTDLAHRNQTYALTGPDLITFEQAAQIMSDTLDKPVRYIPQSAEEFREVLSGFVKDPWQLNGVCELFGEIAAGSLDEQSDDLKNLLGHTPGSLQQFVADYRQAFTG